MSVEKSVPSQSFLDTVSLLVSFTDNLFATYRWLRRFISSNPGDQSFIDVWSANLTRLHDHRKAVDSLQRASDAQQVRLEESRRAHAEEVARLQHKLSTQKSGAAGAAARLEEESSAKVVAEARIVTLMAGEDHEGNCSDATGRA